MVLTVLGVTIKGFKKESEARFYLEKHLTVNCEGADVENGVWGEVKSERASIFSPSNGLALFITLSSVKVTSENLRLSVDLPVYSYMSLGLIARGWMDHLNQHFTRSMPVRPWVINA